MPTLAQNQGICEYVLEVPHMLLAINVGNTNVRIGLFEETNLRHTWRIRTEPHRTADEYEYLLSGIFRSAGVSEPEHVLDASVFASVVPPLTNVFHETLTRLAKTAPVQASTSLNTGIRIGTDNPPEMGADLLANAVAACHTFKQNCIVIDFGTALTFTVVSQDGEVLGVSIAPGVQGALGSLISETAQLHQVGLLEPPSVLGKNTTHSIQSGIMFGFSALVEGIVERIARETKRSYRIIATGGLSEIFAPLIPAITCTEPYHTLQGLRILYELNS